MYRASFASCSVSTCVCALLRQRASDLPWCWIVVAALVNAVGGTARQIAWLGVLVMVPSTLWLLRRDRRVLVTGSLACIAAIGFVFAAMHWFAEQPYSVPEALIPDRMDWKSFGSAAMHGSGQLSRSLLPVLLMFLGPLWIWSRRMAAVVVAVSVCYGLLSTVFHSANSTAVSGAGLGIASDGFFLLRAGATVIGFLSFASRFLGSAQGRPCPQQMDAPVSWQRLGIVLVPFTLAYIIMLVPRAAGNPSIFRYTVPLSMICLLLLTRYYQQGVRVNLPIACAVLIVLIGSLRIVRMHDDFALYRGYVSAIDEIRSSDVPATSIWGPWEFDGWTEIEKVGYVSDSRIRVPKGAYAPPPARVVPTNCVANLFGSMDRTPAIKPVYVVSKDPIGCGGPAGFPPVTYRTWIAPHDQSIYIVKLPASLSH